MPFLEVVVFLLQLTNMIGQYREFVRALFITPHKFLDSLILPFGDRSKFLVSLFQVLQLAIKKLFAR